MWIEFIQSAVQKEIYWLGELNELNAERSSLARPRLRYTRYEDEMLNMPS